MKRAHEEEEEQLVKDCGKRFCLTHAAPKARLTLEEIQKELDKIKSWKDAMVAWTSLSKPVPDGGRLAANWLDDYVSGHWCPHNNGKFILFVRHVLAATYRCTEPTEEVTRIVDKYLKYYGDEAEWESPIELLLCRLFFDDHYEEDFVTLALELVKDSDELIGLCCWAITARQIPGTGQRYPTGGQMDYTRSAVSNLVALILTLKKGPAFTYNECGYEFQFGDDKKVKVWIPDFARFWFDVEMPNFSEQETKIDQFLALLGV